MPFVPFCGLLRGTFKNQIEHTCLKNLAINVSFLNHDRILRSIHRIVLLRIALKMNLRDQRLIAGTDCRYMKMRAAPEFRSARRIRSIGNWTNALDFVLTILSGDNSAAITKVSNTV